MKHLFAIICLLGCALAFPQKRLIKVNPESEAWLNEDEIMFLKKIGVNFLDITETPDLEKTPAPKRTLAFPSGPSHQSEVRSLLSSLDPKRFKDDLTTFSQDFYNRYYRSPSGVESANWLFNTVRSVAGNRSDITVSQFSHSGYDQRSVIARMEGKNNKGPTVIIGAHQDSINLFNPVNGRSPGADDDGSGSISLLEILRALIADDFVPELPIEFQWYAAEEAGLLGSQDIAQRYKNEGRSVYGMFQLDMTAYRSRSNQPVKVLYDFVNRELADFTTTIVEEYTSLTWQPSTCGYGCSDHASWNRAGYDSSSIFEPQTNPQIHTAGDDLNLIDWDLTTEFLKLGLGVVVELSYGV